MPATAGGAVIPGPPARAGRGAIAALSLTTVAALGSGCGSGGPAGTGNPAGTAAVAPAALVQEMRPIGHAPSFHPPARGPVVGACRPRLGQRHGIHLELFAANRVMLLAAGIGTRPPRRVSEGRIVSAACYGSLVTLEPTGVILVRAGTTVRLASVFRSWGQPLSPHRLASFPAGRGRSVQVFVDGRRWAGPPGSVPLRPHSEVVLEVGPPVPPHSRYTFPPGA
ncbi:MAG TPA: hypothetical protein VF781_02000 [Solirubrobacteraceae bacterium]